MSSAAANPLTSPKPGSQTTATRCPTTKPVYVRRSPAAELQQRLRLDQEEEEEPHSDTAVGTAAGSSQSQTQPGALPKDNINNDEGSEYAASSGSEEPVPATRTGSRRASTRLRRMRGGVRAPSENVRDLIFSGVAPVLEGPIGTASGGRKRSRSPSVVSVPERATPRRRRVSKRPTESTVHASQKRTQRPAHHAAAGGAGRNNAVKRPTRKHSRIPARSPHHQVCVEIPVLPISSAQKRRATGSSKPSRTIPEPVRRASTASSRINLTHPKSQVTTTGAGSTKPPPEDGSVAMRKFLSGIGLGESHVQILNQEGIKTQRDLDGLQQMGKECVVELREVLMARGFTAFEFSKVEYAIIRKKD